MISKHKPIAYGVLLGGILLSSGIFLGSTTYAQSNATSITTTASADENEIFQRGIATSVPIKGAHNLQGVIILPPREDGGAYEGTLTFGASKPLEVIFGHTMPIDNSTYSQIDPRVFGKIPLFDTAGAPEIPKVLSSPSFILPDYGSSTPHFSASIPFVASAVVLGSLTDPFVTVYEVSARIIQPETVIELGTANISATSADSTDSRDH